MSLLVLDGSQVMKELDYALGRILYATTGRDLDENSADVLSWCLWAKDSGENHQKRSDVFGTGEDRSKKPGCLLQALFFVRNLLLRIHGRKYFVCKKKLCLTRLI